MANHVRRQVRDAIAVRLTGLTTTGSRVYVNNVDPLAVAELPALTIRNGAEQIDRQSLGSPNPYVRRAQTVIVSAHVRAASAPADTIDEIAKEVEVAMCGTIDAITLGGLAVDTMLVAIDEPRISGDGERIVASADMQFQVLLNAREGIPDAVI
jgi:hypothetical protein